MARFDSIAAYIRRSKEEQSDEHRLDDINEWLTRNDLNIGDVETYAVPRYMTV